MHVQDILYYVFWAGLFFAMMRFGCGAHIMGHGHDHGMAGPDHKPGADAPSLVPDRVTDPVCGMNLQTADAKTAAYNGLIYYFCSQNCREKFEATPDSYLKSGGVAALEKEPHHGCH